VVVVANRLPVRREGDGWEVSPGGLVSALTPILEKRDGSWVGWTGIPDYSHPPFTLEGIEQRPVPLSAAELETFYLGFCNGTIWPLYHDALRTPEFHRHWWRPYVAANQRFAEEAASATRTGDVAWIHDYQLQLVPAMLRRLRGDISIGFFLHIPFPAVELFARLPWRTQMLEGLLGADVIGFQTRLAAQNFARAAVRFTSATGTTRQLEHEGRTIRLQVAPISIDTAGYRAVAGSPEVVELASRLRDDLGPERIILLGVDRLDYTKGIDVRLRAFETLLTNKPMLARRAVLVQVAVPSREEIEDYADMRNQVEQLTGRINGEFGRPGWTPVLYLYRNLPPEELVAYYRAADVMVVTPLRDGMNLVCKEYVASRVDGDGVLVLSEFAGAAQELSDAIIVNPHDLDGTADALERAMTMPPKEARRRMARMRAVVERQDVFGWAAGCLEELGIEP
jgi:alpha,alpha-trehalose-phosphate synthase [UDP-forming]